MKDIDHLRLVERSAKARAQLYKVKHLSPEAQLSQNGEHHEPLHSKPNMQLQHGLILLQLSKPERSELHAAGWQLLLRRSVRGSPGHLLRDMRRRSDRKHGGHICDPQSTQNEDGDQYVHTELGDRRRPLHFSAAHQHSGASVAPLAVRRGAVQNHFKHRPLQHLLEHLLSDGHECGPVPGGAVDRALQAHAVPNISSSQDSESVRVAAGDPHRRAVHRVRGSLHQSRRHREEKLRAEFPQSWKFVVQIEPDLHPHTGLCHSGVYDLHSLHHDAVQIKKHALEHQRQSAGQSQEEGDYHGVYRTGRVPVLLDALSPQHHRGADHRPADHTASHRHLVLHYQPELRQLLSEPVPLRLPGRQLQKSLQEDVRM